MRWTEIVGAFQLVGVLAAVWGAFSAMRARDNARAATLAEIQLEIRHLLRRADALERALRAYCARARRRGGEEDGQGRMGA